MFRKISNAVTTFLLACVFVRILVYFFDRFTSGQNFNLTDACVAVVGAFAAFLIFAYLKAMFDPRSKRKGEGN